MKLPIPFLHRWTPMKWGVDGMFRCRECRICGRFELFAYGSYSKVDRAVFSDAEPVSPVVGRS